MTGVPVSNWTLIKPCETVSQMYSKCIVDPFSKHPIAITAENAAVDPDLDLDWDSGVGVLGLSVSIRDKRLVVDGSMDGALLAD
jgi:hypothetical protein